MYKIDDGIFLVTLARKTIDEYLKNAKAKTVPEDTSEKLKEKAGVFVTLDTYPNKELRGCIGHPYPDSPLVEATIDSAISAATRDPRFPRVKIEELENIVIDISILTPPKLLEVNDPKEYISKIEIGKSGLIAELGFMKGLLLPQVPVEYKWSQEEFLAHTCMKAGLPLNAWKD
ncbi:unnamed protein product, partial [marine sediment metagenome]